MTPQQAENLRVLIRHMEKNVTRMLDMSRYQNACGTPACALGEAQAIGLIKSCEKEHISGECFGIENGLRRARLFGTCVTNAWGRSNVTPKEWIVEARRMLAEDGYSMGDDGFASFMAKVREPVALEA